MGASGDGFVLREGDVFGVDAVEAQQGGGFLWEMEESCGFGWRVHVPVTSWQEALRCWGLSEVFVQGRLIDFVYQLMSDKALLQGNGFERICGINVEIFISEKIKSFRGFPQKY